MKIFIIRLFAFIVDSNYRRCVIQIICNSHKNCKLKKIIELFLEATDNDSYKEVLPYVKKHSNIIFPYDFTLEYNPRSIKVYRDSNNKGFMYVLHNGKKLYVKKEFKFSFQVQSWYNGLLIEQDINSPHRYLTKERLPDMGSIVADIGGAEGIFALDIIDYVKKVYIFECDEKWIEALNLTFAPYKDKVEIVNKFVGDKTDNSMVRLDDFFKDKELDYIKADIEGWEEKMLFGARNILNNKVSKLLCCIYHRKDSEDFITELLKNNGFSIDINKGYIIFTPSEQVIGEPLSEPYLRHGVLYASKEIGKIK